MKQESTKSQMRRTKRSEKEKKELTIRLRRCEGQLRGIAKMVEEDAYCPDILIQVAAVIQALNGFNKELLSCHLKGCVAQDIRAGREGTLEELALLMKKMMR